jgi:hypothetical protein
MGFGRGREDNRDIAWMSGSAGSSESLNSRPQYDFTIAMSGLPGGSYCGESPATQSVNDAAVSTRQILFRIWRPRFGCSNSDANGQAMQCEFLASVEP